MQFDAIAGYSFDDLHNGMRAVISRTITETDVRLFAGVSGDTNPMHLNEEFAENTQFEGCIVHGLLTASLISTVVGTKLPGPGVIYLKQSLKFVAPVYIGDTVYAMVEITELIPARQHVVLDTRCVVEDKDVLTGDALVKVPAR